MTLRIRPIAPRPVRTVAEMQKRRKAEKQAALHARLAKEIQEKRS